MVEIKTQLTIICSCGEENVVSFYQVPSQQSSCVHVNIFKPMHRTIKCLGCKRAISLSIEEDDVRIITTELDVPSQCKK